MQKNVILRKDEMHYSKNHKHDILSVAHGHNASVLLSIITFWLWLEGICHVLWTFFFTHLSFI